MPPGEQFFLDKTGQPSFEVICECRGIFVKGCPVLSGLIPWGFPQVLFQEAKRGNNGTT